MYPFRAPIWILALTTTLAPPSEAATKPQATAAKFVVTRKNGDPIQVMYSFDVSKNGRYVVFVSSEYILPDLQPAHPQIYRLDRKTHEIRLVSQGGAGEPANLFCSTPTVSNDGKHVVFTSLAGNFDKPANGYQQILHADLEAGTVSMLSCALGGAPANANCLDPRISGDGKVVVFASSAPNLAPSQPEKHRIYAVDLETNSRECVSVSTAEVYADGDSSSPVPSDDGRYVAFETTAPNLPAPGSGAIRRVVVRDRTLGTTALVSMSPTGELPSDICHMPAISSDGRLIAYLSPATNLAQEPSLTYDLFVFDRVTETTTRIEGGFDVSLGEYPQGIAMSHNGRRVVVDTAFQNPNDAMISGSKFRVYDRKSGKSIVLATAPDYEASPVTAMNLPRLSGTGRKLWFFSQSPTIVGNEDEWMGTFELPLPKQL